MPCGIWYGCASATAADEPQWFVQAHDDREAVQVSPDELPVIDIHSL
jgi:hypothetical protein